MSEPKTQDPPKVPYVSTDHKISDLSYAHRLFLRAYNRAPEEFMDFPLLQTLNLVRLQNELILVTNRVHRDRSAPCSEELREAGKLLAEYSNALRTHLSLRAYRAVNGPSIFARAKRVEDLTQLFPEIAPVSASTEPSSISDVLLDAYYTNDPSLDRFSSETPNLDSIRDFLRCNLPARLTYTWYERHTRPEDYRDGWPPTALSPFVDMLARCIVAFAGGASLIIPMLVMAIYPSILKSLVTVSVAVTFFAAVVSFGVRASNLETLGATATYAAVLVVFVGTSSTKSS